jgi:hypothetical protein
MKTPTRIEMQDFKRLLDSEIELYNRIEVLMAEKKQAIVLGDLDKLIQLDNVIEQLTEHARDLEKERLALMVQMGRDGETLREFIDSLESGEDAVMLNHARAQLINTMDGIKRLSKSNRDLLTQSIRFIEQSIDVIASILAPKGPSYKDIRTSGRNASESELNERIGIPSTINCEA